MISSEKYIEIMSAEWHGEYSIGVKILVASNLGDNDFRDDNLSYAIRKCGEKVFEDISRYRYKHEQVYIEYAKEQKVELLNLFGDRKIFVEEIPNGYCSQYCCEHLPWFIVTTSIGRFKIGWRKSVIHIEWTDTLMETTAKVLFPGEDVTKEGCMIHAWGYEEAKKYIDIVFLEYETCIEKLVEKIPD